MNDAHPKKEDGSIDGNNPESVLSIHKILVPLDFSGHAQKALRHAEALAHRFEATLRLVHVVEPMVYPSDLGYTPVLTDDLATDLRQDAETRLAAVKEEVSSRGIQAEIELRSGRPYLEITRAAKDGQSDMIVITTHGYTGLKHVLLGSTAERVVRHAPCPVLVVRDPADEESLPASKD